jgi:hypothetical protein
MRGPLRLMLGLAVVALVSGSCLPKKGPLVTKAPTASFQVAPLAVSGGAITAGPWRESTEVVNKETLHVVVVSSWCPHCQTLIARMADDAGLRAEVDMVLLYEDEASRLLNLEVLRRRITQAEADEAKARLAAKGQMLAEPEALEGRDLPFYLIKAGQFEKLVDGYPTFIDCTATGCHEAK